MPSTPSPESGPSRRLTERERRALDEIEAALLRSDPRLGSRLARRRRPGPSRGDTTTDRVVQIVVLIVLCVVVLPGSMAATLIVLGGMCGLAVVAFRAARNAGT